MTTSSHLTPQRLTTQTLLVPVALDRVKIVDAKADEDQDSYPGFYRLTCKTPASTRPFRLYAVKTDSGFEVHDHRKSFTLADPENAASRPNNRPVMIYIPVDHDKMVVQDTSLAIGHTDYISCQTQACDKSFDTSIRRLAEDEYLVMVDGTLLSEFVISTACATS